MRALLRSLGIAICILSLLISVPVVVTGTLRSAYVTTLMRHLAPIWPYRYIFIGDSLTLDCAWHWVTPRPLSTAVLAQGGAGILGIAPQLTLARALGAKKLFIAAGINDILLHNDSTERIATNFEYLLRGVSAGQDAVVTLVPYVSNPAFAPRIAAANSVIAKLAGQRGFQVIDLNPQISVGGVRKPEMTRDGVHFTRRACAIWAAAVKAKISRMGADKRITG